MAGYTPLFSSLTTGTLCGRWPDIGLWPIVLSMADKHGIVDVTPQYISGVTGLDAEQIVACMKRFCEPDPYSRTGAESGARLVLIDPHRDWGWRIVNHGKYREKARLMAKDSVRTESGEDAARKRKSRVAPRRPPKSPAGPLSNADANTNKDSKKPARKVSTPKTPIPDDFTLDTDLTSYAQQRLPSVDPVALLESFRGKALAKGWEYANWRQALQEYIRNCAPNSGHWAAGQYPKQGGGQQWQ